MNNSISLTREQISKLNLVYEYFKDFNSFTVTLEENGKVLVSFDISDIKHKQDKHFIQKI